MSYYIKPDGDRRYFKEIADEVKTKHPELVGRHIFQQLHAVGLYEEFNKGHTPVGLPFSFSEECKS